MGLGSTLVLVTLGGLRDFLGQGTLFDQVHPLLGEAARGLTLTLGPDFHGALVAILPPGAFIGLGLLIALKNLFDQRLKDRAKGRADRSAVQAEATPAV